MATYINLLKFTQQGIKNIKQGPERLDAAKQAFKAAGAEIKDFYLTMWASMIQLWFQKHLMMKRLPKLLLRLVL